MSSTRERFGRNVRWLGFLQVVLLLVRFLPRVVLWRLLGDVGLGQYQIALIWLELSSDALGLAQEDYVPRDAARPSANRAKLVGATLTVTALMIPIVALAMVGVAHMYGDALGVSLAAIFVAALFRAPTRTLLAFYSADENLRPFSLWQAGERTAIAVVTLAVLGSGGGVDRVFLCLPVVYVALGLPVWIDALRRYGVRPVSPGELVDAVRKGLEFTGLRATSLLYLHANSLLVERLLGMGPAGVYVLAKSLVDLLKTPTVLIAKSLYPVMTRRVDEGRRAATDVVAKFEKMMVTFALPIVVGNAFVAVPLFSLVYSGDSTRGAELSIPFTFALLLSSMRRPLATFLTTIHRQNTATAIMTAGVVVNVAATWILAPRVGLVGAVAAVLAYEAITLVAFAVVSRREGVGLGWIRIVRGPVIAAAAMAAVVAVTHLGLRWPLVSVVASGAVAYVGVLLAVGLDADERTMVRSIVGRQLSGTATK